MTFNTASWVFPGGDLIDGCDSYELSVCKTINAAVKNDFHYWLIYQLIENVKEIAYGY